MQFSPYCWKIQTRKKTKKSNHNNKSDQRLTSLSTNEISKFWQSVLRAKKMQVTMLGLVSVLHLVGWSFPIKPQTKVKRNQSNYPGSLFKLTAHWINEISAYRTAVYGRTKKCMYFLFQDARIQEVTKEFCEWVAGLVSFILINNSKKLWTEDNLDILDFEYLNFLSFS